MFVRLLEVSPVLAPRLQFPPFLTRSCSWSKFGHLWIDHDDEYPFSCGSMVELARGWLVLMSMIVFAGPVAAAAVVAAALAAVLFVAVHIITVFRCDWCEKGLKFYPRLFTKC